MEEIKIQKEWKRKIQKVLKTLRYRRYGRDKDIEGMEGKHIEGMEQLRYGRYGIDKDIEGMEEVKIQKVEMININKAWNRKIYIRYGRHKMYNVQKTRLEQESQTSRVTTIEHD